MSLAGGSYDTYELDCLVSRRLDLSSVSTPTMVLQTRYNIEAGSPFGRDRGYVLVSTDGGANWTAANYKGGSTAYFAGYEAAWFKAEVDLTPFAGSFAHVALVFASEGDFAGQQSGQPAGWWVDDITIAYDYVEQVPSIAGVTLNTSIAGTVPQVLEFPVEVMQPSNVTRVKYILDVAPVGSLGGKDVIVESTVAPYTSQIVIPATGLLNQVASLRVQYFDSNSNSGPEYSIPVVIFNLPGDTSGPGGVPDGTVNQSDLDAFSGRVGAESGSGNYVVFCDSDLDGTITELDAAAVGYNWGNTVD
jgi:hypothetical protein